MGAPDKVGSRISRAIRASEDGSLDEAMREIAAVLESEPNHAIANYLYGVLQFQRGDAVKAREFLRKAVRLDASHALWHSNLSHVLSCLNEFELAISHAQKAIELQPSLAEAYNHLGNAQQASNQGEKAIANYRNAVNLKPDNPWLKLNLGFSLQQQNMLAEAESIYREVTNNYPSIATAYVYLGTIYLQTRRLSDAYTFLSQATELEPANDDALNNLGMVCMQLAKPGMAIGLFKRALEQNPRSHGAVANLLSALVSTKKYEEAHSLAMRCLEDRKLLRYTISHVIEIFGQLLDFDRRDRAYQFLLEPGTFDSLKKDMMASVMLSLNYTDLIPEEKLATFHISWGRLVEAAIQRRPGQIAQGGMGARKLRIGYVSPDFREHSVGYFIRNVIASHNSDRFEIYGYFTSNQRDQLTSDIESHCKEFRSVTQLTDSEIVDLIQEDRIDILVDLAGHTAKNRLIVFAYKPSPMSISWIGYLNTTGLTAVDYRISDPYADTESCAHGTEKVIRLPRSFLCFGEFPETKFNDQPAMVRNGYPTFASFNNLEKIHRNTIRLWADILKRVPAARLMIVGPGSENELTRKNLLSEFSGHGVTHERVIVRALLPRREYLHLHNDIDVLLDTFPFNGGTVSAGGLWMGVPIVTLVGQVQRQRTTYSMLKNIGVEESIAWSREEYVQRAVMLVSDPEALTELRRRIHKATRQSILCDPLRFTREYEQALQETFGDQSAQ